MTEYAVRGYWITGAIAFMGTHFSSETNDRLLSGLPKELRLALAGLDPVQWCPRAHHVELMNAIASVQRNEAGAYEDLLAYGQYVGSELANGALRPFMLIATLKLFAKKLPAIWTRDHQDDGKLESDIAQLDEARLPLRFTGIRGYDHVGVVTLGWVKGALGRFVRKGVQVKQTGWSLRQGGPNEMSCEVSWS
jgi:hypothetical protein